MKKGDIMSRAKPLQNAFTLIELLFVVTIIFLLSAVLFPVFSRVREKARSTSCLSNCKQIGLAIMMYAQDSDETLPHQWWHAADCETPLGWAIRI